MMGTSTGLPSRCNSERIESLYGERENTLRELKRCNSERIERSRPASAIMGSTRRDATQKELKAHRGHRVQRSPAPADATQKELKGADCHHWSGLFTHDATQKELKGDMGTTCG